MTESPWFKFYEKPTRRGDYRVRERENGAEFWAHWNGRWWLSSCYWRCNTRLIKTAAVNQNLFWKGVVK